MLLFLFLIHFYRTGNSSTTVIEEGSNSSPHLGAKGPCTQMLFPTHSTLLKNALPRQPKLVESLVANLCVHTNYCWGRDLFSLCCSITLFRFLLKIVFYTHTCIQEDLRIFFTLLPPSYQEGFIFSTIAQLILVLATTNACSHPPALKCREAWFACSCSPKHLSGSDLGLY